MTDTKSAPPTETDAPATAGTRLSGWRWQHELERLAVPLAWGVIIVIFSVLRPDTFWTVGNFATILGSNAVLVVLALGLLLPLRAGDYDLSVAGTLTLSAMMLGILSGEHHINIVPVIALAVLMGALVGLVNGLFVLIFGINPFIVTLGMGTLLLGIVLLISGDATFSGISQHLVNVVIVYKLLGIPLEFYYGLVVCLAIWYLFVYTTLGRKLLFVGTARNVARLSGIGVGKIRLGALVGAGVLAALAGVLYAGTSGSADPTSGASFLLPAYAAAFLGATTIVPGRFNAWGTVIAAYFLLTGVTGLAILGLGPWVEDVFYGGALIVAVALSQLARRRTEQEIS